MSQFPDIEYAHFTVPHSGTRYINGAVVKALGAEKIYQISNLRAYNNTHNREGIDTRLMFCHIGPRWDEFIELVMAEDHIKTWITVRSPIATWGTHWGNMWNNYQRSSEWDIKMFYEKLGDLRAQYSCLVDLAPKAGYIHRVEDPIDKLGDYLNLELDTNNDRFSRHTPMKDAIKNRNVKEIERLCEGNDYWKAFHDYITPDYREFWESLGYEIWWT